MTRRDNQRAAAFMCALALAPATAMADTDVPLWEGIGAQDGATWTLRLAIEDGRYRISYPSLCCGGIWERLGSEGDTSRFRERLEYGQDRCIDNGLITLTDFGKSLHYSYEITEEGGQIGSAILHPAGTAPANAALQEQPSPVLACKAEPYS